MVPENWHICVNKGITYLLTYVDAASELDVMSALFTYVLKLPEIATPQSKPLSSFSNDLANEDGVIEAS